MPQYVFIYDWSIGTLWSSHWKWVMSLTSQSISHWNICLTSHPFDNGSLHWLASPFHTGRYIGSVIPLTLGHCIDWLVHFTPKGMLDQPSHWQQVTASTSQFIGDCTNNLGPPRYLGLTSWPAIPLMMATLTWPASLSWTKHWPVLGGPSEMEFCHIHRTIYNGVKSLKGVIYGHVQSLYFKWVWGMSIEHRMRSHYETNLGWFSPC